MANYGKEDDMFDPVAVEQGRLDRLRRRNDTDPRGRNRYCSRCGAVAGMHATDGCVCPNCGCQLRTEFR